VEIHRYRTVILAGPVGGLKQNDLFTHVMADTGGRHGRRAGYGTDRRNDCLFFADF